MTLKFSKRKSTCEFSLVTAGRCIEKSLDILPLRKIVEMEKVFGNNINFNSPTDNKETVSPIDYAIGEI